MKAKKVLAMLMASAMIMGTSVMAFAAENEATIAGIESGLTVTAYQIIKYNDAGYYEEVLTGTINKDSKGNLAPTAANVEALAGRTGELNTTVQFTEEGTVYTADSTDNLTAGTWMIIVTGSDNYLYNPAIISVQQGEDGLEYGDLNLATDSWVEEGETIYVKRAEPTITKEATDVEGNETVNGVQYGDILKFTITADVPDYTPNKKNISYSISDSLTGLELVKNEGYAPSATVGNQPNAELTTAVTIAIVDGATSFEIDDLTNEFIIAHGGEKIVITYYAQVTTDAEINVDKTTNTATLEYSTNDEVQSKSDDTKHYTFGIDTSFSGTSGSTSTTGEFIKIDDKGNVSYSETGEVTVTEGTALDGAEFQLHIGSENGNLFKDADGKSTFTTDETGRLEINGLDSDIMYYLVETKAPTGYTLNEKPIPFKINATYDTDDETLIGYTVTIDGVTTNYNYNDQGKTTTLINDEDNPSNPYGFKNTKLADLPSTGGIGTTIFTIGGCAIMVTAAGLYFATRKKEQN